MLWTSDPIHAFQHATDRFIKGATTNNIFPYVIKLLQTLSARLNGGRKRRKTPYYLNVIYVAVQKC